MAAPRILLVDDHREISRMLRSSLELAGRGEYTIVDVPSGEEALLELARGPVDLLVTDYRLPGMSGLELLEKVRKVNPDVRAIMITAHSSDEVRSHAEALGVVALLSKPIDTTHFLEAVDQATSDKMEPPLPRAFEDDVRQELEQRLANMQRNLGSSAAVLLDGQGLLVAQVGHLEGTDLEPALPALVNAFSAGLKVSQVLGSLLPENFQYFDGDSYDFYLTNVGAYYALLIAFGGKQGPGQMGSVVHYGRRSADQILDLLSAATREAPADGYQEPDTVPLLESESEQEEAVEQAPEPDLPQEAQADPDQALLAFLENQPAGELSDSAARDLDLVQAADEISRSDAERFWDEALSGPRRAGKTGEDVLTYEEALEQGLLPDEPESEA